MTGAVFAGVPLHLASEAFGWRIVTLVAGIVGLILAVAVWMIVRDDPTERGYSGYVSTAHAEVSGESEWQKLKRVFSYRNSALLALAPGGIVGSVLAFSGLWGIPFLTDVYGLSLIHI